MKTIQRASSAHAASDGKTANKRHVPVSHVASPPTAVARTSEQTFSALAGIERAISGGDKAKGARAKVDGTDTGRTTLPTP